jgi:hypothetical protein
MCFLVSLRPLFATSGTDMNMANAFAQTLLYIDTTFCASKQASSLVRLLDDIICSPRPVGVLFSDVAVVG